MSTTFYNIVALMIFACGVLGLVRFLKISGMLLLILIIAFFLVTGLYWAVIFAL